MKNYLVGAVRPVQKIWGYWRGDHVDPAFLETMQKYNGMYDCSRLSARKFLAGDWEEIKFTAPVLDARMYQIAQWYAVKELWFREPCNILCMGADTLFIKPTEIFGRYNKMMMFNYTDPRYHKEFEHYFNDDIRYYPATMDPKVWDIGEQKMEGWFEHSEANWGWGQLIHNYQMWSQGVSVNEVLDPTVAFQMLGSKISDTEAWNNCPISTAKILHFHGSRDADNRLSVMTELVKQFVLDKPVDQVPPKLSGIITLNI